MNSTAGGVVSVMGGHPPALCSLLPATGCPDATFKGAPPLVRKNECNVLCVRGTKMSAPLSLHLYALQSLNSPALPSFPA